MFDPLTSDEMAKRRIIWPTWLLDRKDNFSSAISSSDELIVDLIDEQFPCLV